MILVQAIIQPIRLSTVRSALEEAGYNETMVSDATGYGRQRGQTAMFRGNEYRIDLLRKVIIELIIDEDDQDEVIEIIRTSARTGTRGEIGDGKIFILPVNNAIAI